MIILFEIRSQFSQETKGKLENNSVPYVHSTHIHVDGFRWLLFAGEHYMG
jgi:hypothetical protein